MDISLDRVCKTSALIVFPIVVLGSSFISTDISYALIVWLISFLLCLAVYTLGEIVKLLECINQKIHNTKEESEKLQVDKTKAEE